MEIGWRMHRTSLNYLLKSCESVCMDWTCPPKFIYWSPNLQCGNYRRWGSWEVLRDRWGHDCGALWWDQCPYKKRPSLQVQTQGRPVSTEQELAGCKPRGELSPETYHTGTLILDFQPRELWEIGICCLSPPAYDILLQQPKQTKIL